MNIALRYHTLINPRQEGKCPALGNIPWKTLQKKVLPDFRDLPYMPAKAPGTGVRG